MAAITCETSLAPSAEATLRLTRCAPGAMPSNRSPPGPGCASWPAMMPAMWVPCPNVSICCSPGVCDSNDRSGPLITFPGWSSPDTGATPESINATPTPAPVSVAAELEPDLLVPTAACLTESTLAFFPPSSIHDVPVTEAPPALLPLPAPPVASLLLPAPPLLLAPPAPPPLLPAPPAAPPLLLAPPAPPPLLPAPPAAPPLLPAP